MLKWIANGGELFFFHPHRGEGSQLNQTGQNLHVLSFTYNLQSYKIAPVAEASAIGNKEFSIVYIFSTGARNFVFQILP